MNTSPRGTSERGLVENSSDLLHSLLYSVSHDLRSPLLTVSLSAQLLEHTLGADLTQGTTEALNSLHAAATDLERMLAALNALSRSARRQPEIASLALDGIAAAAPEDIAVLLDRNTAAELANALADATTPPSIDRGSSRVHLEWTIEGAPDGSSPLAALTASLQNYAGGAIERLACLEITLANEGGSLELAEGRVRVSLPTDGSIA